MAENCVLSQDKPLPCKETAETGQKKSLDVKGDLIILCGKLVGPGIITFPICLEQDCCSTEVDFCRCKIGQTPTRASQQKNGLNWTE